MTHRLAQIESTLHRAISEVLARRMSDPRLAGLISVTKVTVSPDLHDAYIYVSVLPEQHQRRALLGLRHAATHIHRLVTKAVAMRTVPHLDFRVDETLKKQAVVFDAIQRGLNRESPLPPKGEGAGETPRLEGEPAAGAAPPAPEDDQP